MGKGRKERRVPFAKVTRQALETYLIARRRIVVASDLLFISRQGGELTSRHVQIMVKRFGECAGIQGVRVSPHTLRHTCATQYDAHRKFSPMDRLLVPIPEGLSVRTMKPSASLEMS